MAVFEMTVDTIFLCYCIDCEENDGINQPYYMSPKLMKAMQKIKEFTGGKFNINTFHIQENPGHFVQPHEQPYPCYPQEAQPLNNFNAIPLQEKPQMNAGLPYPYYPSQQVAQTMNQGFPEYPPPSYNPEINNYAVAPQELQPMNPIGFINPYPQGPQGSKWV